MNNKKIVVLGGGTGMSTLLRGLKLFPVDITAVVSVSDDGKSTGRLRKEFNTIAVGDLRRVIVSLSEQEALIDKFMNYRFDTTSDLDGHTVGNLILTALSDIEGNLSDGIESLSQIFKLRGRVLPLTEDYATLAAVMEDDSIVYGEHKVTGSPKAIKKVFYKEKVETSKEVLSEVESADLIVLSMGSLYTSVIPNLINNDMKKALKKSKAKIMYVCNIMTEPGETDNYTASSHIRVLNKYLGKRKVDVIVINDGKINDDYIEKYRTKEEKDVVTFDKEAIKKLGVSIVHNNYVDSSDGTIKHNIEKLSLDIFSYLINHAKKKYIIMI